MFITEYYIVLGIRLKTNKNSNENPDLPMDIQNLAHEPKFLDFSQMSVIAKKKCRTSKRNP
jgi:hypothetical protein